jgi:hypothetical protein
MVKMMAEALMSAEADIKVIRRDRLGGLLHEHSQVAQVGRVSGTHTLLRARTIGIGTHVQGNVCP